MLYNFISLNFNIIPLNGNIKNDENTKIYSHTS